MIPLARIAADADDIAAVVRALESGRWASGPEVQAFQDEFAAYCGVRHAVAVSSGAAALHAALVGVGVSPGDVVITTPLTFIATSHSIVNAGARPAYCDVDRDSFCLDPASLAEAVRRFRPAAILCVHLFGHCCDMDAVTEIAERAGIPVVEDAAQAHGATWRGRRAGSLGAAGAFSFYATKNLPVGEGGMLTTDRDEVADRVRRFVNHGRSRNGDQVEVGYNYRMSSLHAALGRRQLEKLEARNARRRAIAACYRHRIDNPLLTHPVALPGADHAYHQYTLRCPDRDALRAWLGTQGIESRVYYPSLGPDTPAHAGRSLSLPLPVAAECTREVLSIPVHHGLTEDEVSAVVAGCQGFSP
jgi:dTDP-4-amino-4,6-dideoxygalactose transaminase